MEILHLATDEKFIDGAMFLFQKAFPSQNRLCVLKPPANPPIKYIRKSKIDREIIKSPEAVDKVNALASDADWVVVHGLNYVWAKFIIENTTKKILYVVWGAEVYGNPYLYSKSLYGEHTAKLAKEIQQKNLTQKIKDFINKYRFNLPNLSQEKVWKFNQKALSKIEYISVMFKDEIELYKDNNVIPETTKFIKFGYYPIEYFMKKIDEDIELENNIMIGNSSSLTNNHLEVFHKLNSLGVQNKMIVPLSYGSKRLTKKLTSVGKKMFGEKFVPITNFLPLKDYTKLMQTCGIVIMNQYRQQAVGNIITAVYLGAKVFLDERNTIYAYLKRLGCHVYKLDEIKTKQDFSRLDKIQISENREILKNDISANNLVRELRNKIH